MVSSCSEDIAAKKQTGKILITAGGVAVVLAAIFIVNSLSSESDEPAVSESSQLSQTAAAEEQQAVEAVAEEPPALWLQAYGGSTGNSAWAPAVTAPFDTLWTLETGREIFSPPAVIGDYIYMAGNDKVLRALNRHTGEQLWSRSVTCGLSGGVAADAEQVYFSGQDGYLYALNRENGSEEWKAGLGYHIFTDAAVLSDTLVLAGNSMGNIAALNTGSGAVEWNDAIDGLVIGPAVSDSIAVFCTESGAAAAWNSSGNIQWTRSFTSQPSAPSIASGRVFIGFSTGKVLALSLATGETIWETALENVSGRAVVTRPSIPGDSLVVAGTCDGRVFCLEASDGSLVWESPIENWVAVTPAVCDKVVYVSCDDSRIHLLNLSDGSPLDTLETGSYSGTPPLILGGTLYTGTAEGDFNAIQSVVVAAEEADCPVE